VEIFPPSIVVTFGPPIWFVIEPDGIFSRILVPSVILFVDVNVTNPVKLIACVDALNVGIPVPPPAVVSTTVYVEYQYLFEFPAVYVGAPMSQFEVKLVNEFEENVYDVADGVEGAVPDVSW
jgi:hypothetical protein